MKNRYILSLLIILISGCIYAQTFDVYVSDAGNFNNPPWQILKFDPEGENPDAFISSNIAWPQDILFLEDQEIVLISSLSTGLITRHNIETGEYINNFAESIGGPTRIKIGADSLLYVLQWTGNGKVWRYNLDGTFKDEFTDTGVSQSIGLDWDSEGNLYVSSYGGGFVQKYNSEGIDQGRFIDSNLAGPTNIWFDDNGDLLVIDYNAGSVKRFDSKGNYIGIFIGGLSFPEGIAFYPNGNFLIGNGGNGAVKLFDSEGMFIEDFIAPGAGNLLTPNAIALRETNPSSTRQPIIKLAEIFPTLGSAFFISPKENSSIKAVSVFNATGDLVVQLDPKRQLQWDAANFADGVYFIRLINVDGGIQTTKLIVHKDNK